MDAAARCTRQHRVARQPGSAAQAPTRDEGPQTFYCIRNGGHGLHEHEHEHEQNQSNLACSVASICNTTSTISRIEYQQAWSPASPCQPHHPSRHPSSQPAIQPARPPARPPPTAVMFCTKTGKADANAWALRSPGLQAESTLACSVYGSTHWLCSAVVPDKLQFKRAVKRQGGVGFRACCKAGCSGYSSITSTWKRPRASGRPRAAVSWDDVQNSAVQCCTHHAPSRNGRAVLFPDPIPICTLWAGLRSGEDARGSCARTKVKPAASLVHMCNTCPPTARGTASTHIPALGTIAVALQGVPRIHGAGGRSGDCGR